MTRWLDAISFAPGASHAVAPGGFGKATGLLLSEDGPPFNRSLATRLVPAPMLTTGNRPVSTLFSRGWACSPA